MPMCRGVPCRGRRRASSKRPAPPAAEASGNFLPLCRGVPCRDAVARLYPPGPGDHFCRWKLPERAGGVIHTAFALEDRPLDRFLRVPGGTVIRTKMLGLTPTCRLSAAAEGFAEPAAPSTLVHPLIQPSAATAQEISWL
jgi:hypothetical protein